MISTKLKALERKLSSQGASATPEVSDSPSSIFIEAMEDSITRIADARIKAADSKADKAEAETADVRKQLGELNRELAQARRDMQSKMDTMCEAHNQEMARMRKDYFNGMQQMQGRIDGLRKELADEQQARVRAETGMDAAEKMCAHMKEMGSKPVAPAPAPAKAPEPKPAPMVKFKVTQRDELGHIVSIEQIA
jgi:DNA anti-recombination protein RmuC